MTMTKQKYWDRVASGTCVECGAVPARDGKRLHLPWYPE